MRQSKSQQSIMVKNTLFPIVEAMKDDSSVDMSSIHDSRDVSNNNDYPRYEIREL